MPPDNDTTESCRTAVGRCFHQTSNPWQPVPSDWMKQASAPVPTRRKTVKEKPQVLVSA